MTEYTLPSPATWIVTGLVMDAAAGAAIAGLLRDKPGIDYALISAALCWVHLVAVPTLAGKGRHTGWRDAGLLLAGLAVTALALATGIILGFVAGLVTFLLFCVPGFLVGGAVAGWVSASAMQRLLGPAQAVATGRAVVSAMASAIVLVGMLLVESSARTELVAMLWLGAATAIATCPAGIGSAKAWAKWRRYAWLAVLVSAALPMALIGWTRVG